MKNGSLNSSFTFSSRNPITSLNRDAKFVNSGSLSILNSVENIQRAQIDQIDVIIDSQKNYINDLKKKYDDLETRHKTILKELTSFKKNNQNNDNSDSKVLKQNLLEEKKMRICAEVQLDILSHLLEYEMSEIHRCKALTSSMTEDRIKLREELKNAKFREESLNKEIVRLRQRAGRLIAQSPEAHATLPPRISLNLQSLPVYLIWSKASNKQIYLGDLEIISKYLQKLDIDAQIWAFCIDKLASLNPKLQMPMFMKNPKSNYDDFNKQGSDVLTDMFSMKEVDFRIYSQDLTMFEVGEDSWNPGNVSFDIEPIDMSLIKDSQIKIYLKDEVSYALDCMLPFDMLDRYCDCCLQNKFTMFLFESKCKNWVQNFIISIVKLAKEKLTKLKEGFYQTTSVIAISSESMMDFLISERILELEKKEEWSEEYSRLILIINWSSETPPDSSNNPDLDSLEEVLNFFLFRNDFIEYKGYKYYCYCAEVHIGLTVSSVEETVFATSRSFTMKNKFFTMIDPVRFEETDSINNLKFPNFPMVYLSERLVHSTIYKFLSWNLIRRMWRRNNTKRSELSKCEILVLNKIMKLWELIYEPLYNHEQEMTEHFDKTVSWFSLNEVISDEHKLLNEFLRWLVTIWNELLINHERKITCFHAVAGIVQSEREKRKQAFALIMDPILFEIQQRIKVDRNKFKFSNKFQRDNETISTSQIQIRRNFESTEKKENNPVLRPKISPNLPVQFVESNRVGKIRLSTNDSVPKPRDPSANRAYALRKQANETNRSQSIHKVQFSIVPKPIASSSSGPVLSNTRNVAYTRTNNSLK